MINMLADTRAIMPEIILIAAAICVLALGFLVKSRKALGYFSLAALAAAVPAIGATAPKNCILFSGMLVSDPFSSLLRILSVYIAAFIILVSMDYEHIASGIKAEFYALLLMVTASMMFLAGANNFLMVYLGIECISLISYVFAAYWRQDLRSSEAGLKYFLFGTACSITMLYGISVMYGLTGSLDLAVVGQRLTAGQFHPAVIFAAMIMFWVGLAFKVAMAPFHFWCPDVYEGAPTPMTAFFSVGPKLLGFAVLVRFALSNNLFVYQHWSHLVGILAILTMVVGNVTALFQKNIKRMLAYSSIAHAGYALIGLVVNTAMGHVALFIYLVTYIAMNLGAFAAVIAVSARTKTDDLAGYEGLSKNSPCLAGLLTVFLVSLAGIPPLAGFIGKFYIFASAMKEGYIYLAVAGAVNSVIAAYYYFNVIRVMYLVPAPSKIEMKVSPALVAALVICLIFVLGIGVYPKPVINFVTAAMAVSN